MLFWCNSRPLIPRGYLQALAEFCLQLGDTLPGRRDWKTEAAYVQLCLITYDIVDHRNRPRLCSTTKSQHHMEREAIGHQLRQWRETLDLTLTDKECLGIEQESVGLLEPDSSSIFDACSRTDAYSAPLSSSTLLIAQWNFVALMHESDSDMGPLGYVSDVQRKRALHICWAWMAVGRLSPSPPGAYTSLIAPLKMAILFLPRNGQYSQWIRRSLAATELQG